MDKRSLDKPALRLTLSFALSLALLLVAGPAAAQETPSAGGATEGGLGVGVEVTATAVPAAAFVYDTGAFHIDGLLSVSSDDPGSSVFLGGRFFWELHSAERADFSLGGGLGILYQDPDGPANDETDIHVEMATKLRAFVAPNVALTATVGIGLVFRDGDDSFALAGRPVGSAGLVYFFR